MNWKKSNRRQFLTGLGNFTLALPFLPSLLPENVMAQATAPRRFISVMSHLGTMNNSFWYPSTAPSTAIVPYSGHHPIHSSNLSAFQNTQISDILSSELNPYLNQLLLLQGLDIIPYLGHHTGAILGNIPAAITTVPGASQIPTIDSLLAYSNRIYSSTPKVRNTIINPLTIGSFSYAHQDPINKTGPIERMPAISNPKVLFDSLFLGVSGNNGNPNIPIMDRVLSDYQSLRNHRRISSADRQKLESHTTLLQELHNRLTAQQGVVCTIPTEPNSVEHIWNHQDISAIEQVYQNHVDVLAAAIKCDLTRVGSIVVEKALNLSTSVWHDASHSPNDPDKVNLMRDANRWVIEKVFVPLLNSLNEDENGNTYLENSVILFSNENSNTHSTNSMPTLIAGGGNGYFKGGLYVDFTDRSKEAYQEQQGKQDNKPGLLYNRLLVTLMQSMGLPSSDYESPGVLGYGTTIDNTNTNKNSNYNSNDQGSILPYITNAA